MTNISSKGIWNPIQCLYQDMNMLDTLQNVFPNCGDKIEELIRKDLKQKIKDLKYVSIKDRGEYNKILLDYDDEFMNQNQTNDPIEEIVCNGHILDVDYIGGNELPDTGLLVFVSGSDVVEIKPMDGSTYILTNITEEELYSSKKWEFRPKW